MCDVSHPDSEWLIDFVTVVGLRGWASVSSFGTRFGPARSEILDLPGVVLPCW